jgi:Ni/Fe-hydrogenase subunit HybB-like protein
MVLATAVLSNMYGHIVYVYKFVKRGVRADAVSDLKKDCRLVCDMIANSYGLIVSEVHQTVTATVSQTRAPRRWAQPPL